MQSWERAAFVPNSVIFGNITEITEAAEKQKRDLFEDLFLLWCHRESNQGHKDFQSFALPTELWHHRFCLTAAKVQCFFESCKSFC